MRLFNEVRFRALRPKEWIPRAPAIVNSSLSGMDTKRMSEVRSDSDGQYASAPPNRRFGVLSGLPHTRLHPENVSLLLVVKQVVCVVKEIHKSRFNDFK